MIPVTSFAGKKVAVFGLGGSGLASASALFAGGADVIGWDDSPERIDFATRAGIPTADLREVDWSRISALVLAPGVPLTHPTPHWTVALARAHAVEVIGDIELFCRERRDHVPDAPFVAVTGTNGKSTTTALVAHLMASAGYETELGGNIGTAILSLEPPRAGRTHVIECSSYQIDLAPGLDPSVGILINLTEDHIDRHGTLANYAAVKERLVAAVQDGGTAIVGVDDRWCQAVADRIERAGKKVVRVSVRRPLADGIYVEAEQILCASGGSARPVALLGGIGSLRGLHNAQNAACAAAAALAFGLDNKAIQAGLWSFPGLVHRMEEVGRKGSVLFVNDSKATNADSAAQALACFSDIFWIAGGKPKTGGIATLENFFPRIRKAYLIGEAANEFAATLDGKVEHDIVETLDKALDGRRKMRRNRACPHRWCCCRRPAPRSTSTATSRCAATRSASRCWRCRALSAIGPRLAERPAANWALSFAPYRATSVRPSEVSRPNGRRRRSFVATAQFAGVLPNRNFFLTGWKP